MPNPSPDAWKPIGIEDLEPVAWDALRHDASSCVVAGPGAGKTEFLAQRACYLLQTGACPRPKRILAISFKRDAAANLAKRVRSRAPHDFSRFVSMTFDAFTKAIVDRFRASLPERWQLRGEYDIAFPRSQAIAGFLDDLGAASQDWRGDLYGIPRDTFLSTVLGSYPLPVEPEPAATAEEFAVLNWWQQMYVAPDVQRVEFVMLNRLAELIIRANPHIQRGLQLTYPFVFVDEFQDTTFAQYSFLRAVFGTSRTVVTAVGDNKQRIMGWAGALDDSFAEFRSDFDSEQFELEWNFRSSDKLIAVQHVFAQALDVDSKRAVSKTATTIDDDDAAIIWRFDSEADEARSISRWIAADIATFGRSPSDYALLARQKVGGFADLFASELAAVGIHLRNDDLDVGKMKLQDLLVDDLALLLIGITRLAATTGGNAAIWTHVSDTIVALRGCDTQDTNAGRVVDDELSRYVKQLRRWMEGCPPDADAVHLLAVKLMEFVDGDAVRRSFVSHKTADSVAIAVDAFESWMAQVSSRTATWADTCDEFEAHDAVALMTVHKSKGLQYHTVFFLSIDDNQWWSHRRERHTSTATFFVGLSRAEQRAIFTYCDRRGNRLMVADLYEKLGEAGVPERHLST